MQCPKCNTLDLFADYVREREGGILLRNEHGFVIYRNMSPDYGYLQDMYVAPAKRRQKVGTALLQQTVDFARQSNKKALLTTTDTATNGATESAISILQAGFKILKTEDTLIWYVLEI